MIEKYPAGGLHEKFIAFLIRRFGGDMFAATRRAL
jgi:hypothetical protein